MDCTSTDLDVLFSEAVDGNYGSILSPSVKDNGSQRLSPNFCCNYSPMLINFTVEANNGEQASSTTEVMKQ